MHRTLRAGDAFPFGHLENQMRYVFFLIFYLVGVCMPCKAIENELFIGNNIAGRIFFRSDGIESNRVIPTFKEGEKLWLGTTKGPILGECLESTELDGSDVKGPGTGVEVRLWSDSGIPQGTVLISRTPFPKQTWHVKNLGNDALLINTLNKGMFKIKNHEVPPPEMPDGYDGPLNFQITILRSFDGKSWNELMNFDSNGSAEPFIDVDGDGIPETVTVERYGKRILERFFPKKEIVVEGF